MKTLRCQIMFILMLCLIPMMSLAFEEVSPLGMTLAQMYDYTTHNEDKRGSLVVLNVKRGSPAHIVGIQEGDILLKVDNTPTRHHDCKDIIDHCLIKPSSAETVLTLWRPENKEQLVYVLRR